MKRTRNISTDPTVEFNVNQEPIILSKALLDRLMNHEKFSDLLALYVFYYYTAKWQQTNRPKATTSYTANGLNWSEIRVRQTKQILIDLKLIKNVVTKNELNQVTGHYIYVRFIWSNEHTEKPPVKNPIGWRKPEGGGSQTVANFRGNALSSNKEYLKEKIKKEKVDFLNTYKKLASAWEEWLVYKKTQHKFKYTSDKSEWGTLQYLYNTLSNKNESKAICIIEQSIREQWKGLHPLKPIYNKNQNGYKPRNGHIDESIRNTYQTDEVI